MSEANRPDFGRHVVEHEGVKLTCRYVAPGLTLQKLIQIYDEEQKKAEPGDEYAGNPTKWPVTRGVSAVTEAILDAVYASDYAKLKEERDRFHAGLVLIRASGPTYGGAWCKAQAHGYLEDLDYDQYPETGKPPEQKE